MFLKSGVGEWNGKERGMEYYVECMKGQGEVLCMTRETRERWLLPIVETEVNGDSKSTNERVLLWLVRWGLPCRYKRFLLSLETALVGPEQNIFFLTVHYFNPLSPSPSKLFQW
jgi:hypothetical protein